METKYKLLISILTIAILSVFAHAGSRFFDTTTFDNIDTTAFTSISINNTGEINGINSTGSIVNHFPTDGTDSYILNSQLGLGTSSPQYLLTLIPESANSFPFLIRDHADTKPIFYVKEDADESAVLYMANSTGTTSIFLDTQGDSYISGNYDFGIGTNAPTQDLEIKRTDGSGTVLLIDSHIGLIGSDSLLRIDSDDDSGIQLYRNATRMWNLYNDRGDSDDLYLKASDNDIVISVDQTGDAWFIGDVSALTFTDRTPFFDGDALSEIKNIKGKDGEIDHSSLPEFAQGEYKDPVYENYIDPETNLTSKRVIGEIIKDGRDIGASVTMNTRAIQQLVERIENLERDLNTISE